MSGRQTILQERDDMIYPHHSIEMYLDRHRRYDTLVLTIDNELYIYYACRRNYSFVPFGFHRAAQPTDTAYLRDPNVTTYIGDMTKMIANLREFFTDMHRPTVMLNDHEFEEELGKAMDSMFEHKVMMI